MSKKFRHALVAIMVIASSIVGVALVIPVAHQRLVAHGGRSCRTEIVIQNRNRRATEGAQLRAECPGIIHSAPFGNWGVTSAYAGRSNGKQFMGWKRSGSQYHWNTCTVSPYRWQAPDRRLPGKAPYMNATRRNGWYWSQQSNTNQRQSRTVHYSWISLRDTCRTLYQGVYDSRDLTMQVFELDPAWRDEKIAEIEYEDVGINLRCSSDWNCSGQTSWMSPTRVSPSSSKVTALLHIRVRTSRR